MGIEVRDTDDGKKSLVDSATGRTVDAVDPSTGRRVVGAGFDNARDANAAAKAAGIEVEKKASGARRN